MIEPDAHPAHPLPSRARTYVNAEGFQAVAVSNIDGDSTLDVWAINDENDLENVVNDVRE